MMGIFNCCNGRSLIVKQLPYVQSLSQGKFKQYRFKCRIRQCSFLQALEGGDFQISLGADKTIKDTNGDTPFNWDSKHLRPGKVLQLLSYGDHRISDKHVKVNVSEHRTGDRENHKQSDDRYDASKKIAFGANSYIFHVDLHVMREAFIIVKTIGIS